MTQRLEGYQSARINQAHLIVSTARVYDAAHSYLVFRELNEFPKNDPWHAAFEEVIRLEAKKGVFADVTILEGGIGVGSLMLEAIFASQEQGQPAPRHIIGVDINPLALDLAFDHLQQIGFGERTELWHAGIIQLLEHIDHLPEEARVGIFCIPQVPDPLQHAQKMSSSDSYDPAFVPEEFIRRYNDVGLALIAGTLSKLHRVAPDDFTAYVMISGRVPRARRDTMIAEMGWVIEEEFHTQEPVQQDPDTKLDAYLHTADHSEEDRFFERLEDGSFSPISIEEAVRRTNAEGISRDNLNVYHYLSVVKLKKQRKY